jgi:alkaline phosphatase
MSLVVPVASAQQQGKAKYVILLIGDGMGLAQRKAAEVFLSGARDPNLPVELKQLTMNSFPAGGLTRTHSLDSLVTDSAASGTAIACGRKTMNGMIGMDPNATVPYRTIAEIAKDRGWKVGIVTTEAIEGATPSCFYAHQSSRGEQYEIAMQLAASRFDYFAGAATRYTEPNSLSGRPSPVEAARRNGFAIVTDGEQIKALKPDAGRVWINVPTAERARSMPYAIDRPKGDVCLADLARKGIELLDNPVGFFLMLEGAKIDFAGHDNDAGACVGDVLDLDRAVEVAVEFYRKHPNETLVIVTADHETGGMTLGTAGGSIGFLAARLAKQKASCPAFEPNVAAFRQKKVPFEDAWPAIRDTFGFDDTAESTLQQIKAAYALSMVDERERSRNREVYRPYGRRDPLLITIGQIVSRQAGIGWTTLSHTGIPVWTTAIGVGSEQFNGYYDNTDIFRKLAAVMGVKVPAVASAN